MTRKKRMRLSKKGIGILAFLVVIVVAVGIFVGWNFVETNTYASLGYSKEAIQTIRKEHLGDQIKEIGENATLNTVLKSAAFQKDNFDFYQKIGNYTYTDLADAINRVKDKGYNEEEADAILRSGDDASLTHFLSLDYQQEVMDFLQFDYAKLENMERYYDYQQRELTSDEDTVTYVNIGLDKDFYTDYEVIHDYSVTVLANKYNQLSENYVPDDLVDIPEEYCLNPDQKMTVEARDAFIEMAKKAKEDGLNLQIRSSYRTYEDQEAIYNDYKEMYGERRADSIAARPGFSEHQTGLVIDIATSQTSIFSQTEEYRWMKDHAYLYGFIQRYPEGKSDITGYNNEAWHYRYVGVDIATAMRDTDLTYDEYYVRYLDK